MCSQKHFCQLLHLLPLLDCELVSQRSAVQSLFQHARYFCTGSSATGSGEYSSMFVWNLVTNCMAAPMENPALAPPDKLAIHLEDVAGVRCHPHTSLGRLRCKLQPLAEREARVHVVHGRITKANPTSPNKRRPRFARLLRPAGQRHKQQGCEEGECVFHGCCRFFQVNGITGRTDRGTPTADGSVSGSLR
jgi:hypothetical protein